MAIEIKLNRPGKGAPPTPADNSINLEKPASGQKVPLQVKVSAELRREFRGFCNDRDMELSDMFIRMYEFYKKHNV